MVVKPHVGAGLTRSLTPREPDAAAARAALRRHACRQAMARCAFESRGRGDVALAIRCCARRAGRRLRPGRGAIVHRMDCASTLAWLACEVGARHFGATCRPSCALLPSAHTFSCAAPALVPALPVRLALASQAAATDKLYTHIGHAGREDAGERTASRARPVRASMRVARPSWPSRP